MTNPILNRLEIRPLTIRRQMLDPGTMLVFQLPDNRLEAPPQGFSITDMLKKRPKLAYVVDVRTHPATFECQLPSRGDAVYFSATVNYTWVVVDPVRVVAQQVSNPESDCFAFLSQLLPRYTRKHSYEQPAAAEQELQDARAGRTLEMAARGLRIVDVYMHLRISEEQRSVVAQLAANTKEQELALARVNNEAELALVADRKQRERQDEQQERLEALVKGGMDKMYAFVIQQDPTKGIEVINRMDAMDERERMHTLESMKVLIDGGQVRLGDLDDAVADAVTQFRSILGQFKAGGKKPLAVESTVGEEFKPAVESSADLT
jgi:hypothetical protein